MLFFWFLALQAMPGGVFLRRTSAIVWSSAPFLRRTGFPLARTCGLSTDNGPRENNLRVRGGGSSGSATNHPPRLSSSARAATASSSTEDGVLDIDKEAQASLSIVGSSVRSASLKGLPYLDTSTSDEFRVLFVLGGPGAGKGTQSDLLKANYPCLHLSAGELLRAETTQEDSPHKELIETCLVSGNIVPVEISLSLLETAMRDAAAEHGKSLIFLVDGFPRNFDNLEGWMRCMKGVASVWGVLNYRCPLEELERRILNRAKDSGRSDDNLQSARKRFATFERDTEPVVDALRKVEALLEDARQPSLRVWDIRGDQTVEEVWADTQAAMNQMISYDVLTAHSQLLEAIRTKNVDLYRRVCADEWFEGERKSNEEVMVMQEGQGVGDISNVKLSYISGTKVAIEYGRTMEDNVQVQEKRIWSHQGIGGWKNIHFARLPAPQ